MYLLHQLNFWHKSQLLFCVNPLFRKIPPYSSWLANCLEQCLKIIELWCLWLSNLLVSYKHFQHFVPVNDFGSCFMNFSLYIKINIRFKLHTFKTTLNTRFFQIKINRFNNALLTHDLPEIAPYQQNSAIKWEFCDQNF